MSRHIELDRSVRDAEHWLVEQVVPAYDAYLADPSCGLSLDEVRTALAVRHQRNTLKKP